MQKDVLQRIKAIIDYLGYSDNQFAKAIEVPQTTISNMFLRNSDVKHSVLSRIVTAFPFVSSEWLLTGRGEMINDDASTTTASQRLIRVELYLTEDEFVRMGLRDKITQRLTDATLQ